MMRSLRSASIVLSAALAVGAFGATAAQADTRSDAPGCSSVTEFGPVAKVVINGETAASIRGYQGCGMTFTMTWVETDWATTHPGYTVFAGIYNTSEGIWVAGFANGVSPTQELWSQGDPAQHQLAGGGIGWHNCQNVNGYVTPTGTNYLNQDCKTS